ncbi:hypothetical protein ACGFI4_08990 [Micromonospora carbonacea]|uniref:hypothetical protein n=1 Tax=Micromonospora carbonacea TaxID=47853 RepID=UPI00372146CD
MLRLRFGLADLSRTVFALPTPYCEMAVSAQVLQQPHSAFRRLWLDGRLRRVPSRAREMFDLVPASGGIPDFLIPEDASSLDEALDVIVSASPARLRAELAQRHWRRQPPSWIQDLARGRSAAVRHLGQLVRSYHEEILEPFWPGVRRAMVTELNRRAWQLATHGAEAALNSLHAGIRWRGGVLEVDGPFDGVVDLDGRGLRVMPSLWTRPGVALAWNRTTFLRASGLVTSRRTGQSVRHVVTALGHAVLAAPAERTA